MRKTNSKGFTLIEVIASMTILVIAISMALSGYLFLLKNANQADVQHQLDGEVQAAIESLKMDLRLSSMDEIFGYPKGAPPYKAISFPVAKINPDTGRLNRDPNTREIIWDETVIYHIVSGAPDKLTKTTFSPRNNTLDDPERQAQLNFVVENDGPQGVVNAENASSKIIFNNLLNWGLSPQTGLFSAYAASPDQEIISMGYSLLNADTNTFTFKIIGRHPDNTTGYKIGIDQIIGSPSYRYQEAETKVCIYDGATAPILHKNISYGNRHELLFNGLATDDSFTITLNNDQWEVTDFSDGGGFASNDKTVILPDYTLDDIVVKLEANDVIWETESQTGDFVGFTTNLTEATISVMLKGANLTENGGQIRGGGQRCCLTFRADNGSPVTIDNVWIGESNDSNNVTMVYSALEPAMPVTFNTGNAETTINQHGLITSDWINIPIDPNKNYIVTYHISEASQLKIWSDKRAFDANTDKTTQIITSSSTNMIYAIPVLESVKASYVKNGIYTSDIMDTKLVSPNYKDFSWDSLIPAGTKLEFKIRYGNNPNLSDADSFKNITAITAMQSASSFFLRGTKRFVQFQALMESDSETNLQTPRLRAVTIDWTGESRMVNVMGKFSKGPDFADFELLVNGKPLQSALIINLEIYKDIQAMNHQTRRVSSAIRSEITPRNSGL